MTFDLDAFKTALATGISDTTVSIDAVWLDMQLQQLFVTATHKRPPAIYSDTLNLAIETDDVGREAEWAATFGDLINKGAPLA